ncbi:glycosyltransferase family 2 protein [Bacillus sp. SB49]|uniref:glycosyltransferase family 2 protein n=1 Tax=Bacillus sp. SB49 TaxID=1071080 RepID=UPI00041087EE|nr:glycosyltransferase family 2 protein [Bacillus sp. SB49]QHT48025.1 glycosyltransferase family 2 protein [Bacillus sp. SB49]
MEEKVILSLAIVTYNNENIIEETIESIISNIPNDMEYKLYIIDNNSSDDTLKIAKKIAGSIEIIALKDNKGFAHGHNIIKDKIRSDYHIVVNPDITIQTENDLRKIISYMEQNEEVGLLSPKILNTDLSIQYLCKQNPTVFDMMIRRISPNLFPSRQARYILKSTGYNQIMSVDYASGCFMVFRSDVYLSINGFDERFFMYLEDADITRRVNQVSKAIYYPEAKVIHAWERGGHKSFKLALITLKSMKIYFKKWGWKLF